MEGGELHKIVEQILCRQKVLELKSLYTKDTACGTPAVSRACRTTSIRI